MQGILDLGEFEAMEPITETEKTVYVVGVSGGKDSAAVLLWMVRESGINPSKILATFSDTGNEHEWTYDHVRKMSDEIHPIQWLKPELDFFELALKKKRFPSTKARFCTESLKIYPAEDFIQSLKLDGMEPVSVSGVRANESFDRAQLSEWAMSGFNVVYPQWRPLISWTIDDVVEIHERHNFPLNPLYAIGAQRVGCWPCIMSRKAEIRNIALRFPDRIDKIREAEQEFTKRYGRYSSFFHSTTIPARFRSMPYIDKTGETVMLATIDDVVKWSMTGKGAKGSYEDEPDENENTIGCHSGFCE